MIYPTGRAVAVMAAGAPGALVVGILSPGWWTAGLAWILAVAGLCIADALLGASAGDARLSIEAPATAPTARASTFRMSLAFAGRPPPRAEIAARGNARISIPQPRQLAEVVGGRAEAAFELVPLRRGEGVIERAWARWRGPLGLAWTQLEAADSRRIALTPNTPAIREEAFRLFSRDALFGLKAQLETGDGSEFHALREFAPGMDRRSIDWKQSARHNRLLAKEHRAERNHPIVFAIDCSRAMCEPLGSAPRVDHAINAALMLAFVSLKLGDRAGLFAFDARPRLYSGLMGGGPSFATLQRLAASLDYGTEEANFTLALAQLGGALERRSLIIFFTEFADPTSASLMIESLGRLLERHLAVFVVMRDEELEQLARREPEDAEAVARAVTAASLLRERDLVVARLRRMGVVIVDAPAARIGPALISAYVDLKRRELV